MNVRLQWGEGMIRKLSALVVTGLLVACAHAPASAPSAQSAPYQSAFGFSVDMPSDWTVMGRQELKDNPDLFSADNPRFKEMDQALLKQVIEDIRAGNMEIYYHTGFGNAGFADNVNAIKNIGKIPATAAELKDVCGQLPGQFSRYFGHTIAMYQCSLTKVGGKNALWLEFDGALRGTRSIQYQVQKSENVTIIITGTFAEATLADERDAFTHIVMSMKMQ